MRVELLFFLSFFLKCFKSVEQVTHAISDLLDHCFDGQPDMDDSSEASFMVHAMDGEKEVTISFDA